MDKSIKIILDAYMKYVKSLSWVTYSSYDYVKIFCMLLDLFHDGVISAEECEEYLNIIHKEMNRYE